jgi:hypothetical protein
MHNLQSYSEGKLVYNSNAYIVRLIVGT